MHHRCTIETKVDNFITDLVTEVKRRHRDADTSK